MRALVPLLLWGCATPSPAEPVPDREPRPDLAEWHVHLDVEGRTIGAYTLSIRFDSAVAAIESIEPCQVRHFRGRPEFDPSTLAGGLTRVTSIDAFPSGGPRGEYHLLTVTFRKIAAGSFGAAALIERLYDEANTPLRGRITQPAFQHVFP